MQILTIEQAADFLSCVSIEQTIDIGSTITHVCNAGTAGSPSRYVFINEDMGNLPSVLTSLTKHKDNRDQLRSRNG